MHTFINRRPFSSILLERAGFRSNEIVNTSSTGRRQCIGFINVVASFS